MIQGRGMNKPSLRATSFYACVEKKNKEYACFGVEGAIRCSVCEPFL